MHARIDNPALAVPDALKPLQAIANALKQADISETLCRGGRGRDHFVTTPSKPF